VVVVSLKKKADLLGLLLRMNYRMRFGAFTVAGNGDVCYEYRLPSGGTTKETVKIMLYAALSTLDEAAPAIIERWGGQRTGDWVMTHAAGLDGDSPPDG